MLFSERSSFYPIIVFSPFPSSLRVEQISFLKQQLLAVCTCVYVKIHFTLKLVIYYTRRIALIIGNQYNIRILKKILDNSLRNNNDKKKYVIF